MSEEMKSESPGLPKIKDATPVGSTTSVKSQDSGISMLPSITRTSPAPKTSYPGIKVKVKVMEPLQDKHICIVCSGILRNPVRFTACGHRCCLTCLAGLLQEAAECPIDQMTLDKKRVTLDDRIRKEIEILPIYCSNDSLGCKWRGTYSNLVSHLAECGYTVIKCPNKGCSECMERRCMEKHAQDECPKFLMACPHCKREVIREHNRKHSQSCPKRPISCPNSCGKPDMTAEKMAKHLEDECPKEMLPCPFVDAGCEFRNVRDVIRFHVTSKSDVHLNLVVDKLVAYQRSLLLHTDVIDDQTQRLINVESRVYALEKLHGTQLLWKIDNFGERMDQAKKGKVPTIYSPPFLSNKHGYQLMMSANLNGGGKARGKFLSTYVCLVPGDYDALLVWPFSHRVTFTLVSATGSNVSTSLKPSTCAENLPFLGRPGKKRNPSFGVENFVKLSTLADYVVDNCLYLSMKVDLMGMMVL